jgi:hypothetical protein
MPLSLIVATGYNFSDGEKVTYPKLNLLGTPSVTFTGELSSAQLSEGAVTAGKLEQGININSKIDDHNLNLTKLEAGTQGQILYYNADGDLVKLAPGSDGQFLRTKGSSAAPEWASQAGLSSVPYTDITTNGNDKYLTTDSSGNIEWINKPTVNTVDVITTSNLDTIRVANNATYSIGYVPEHIRVTVYCDVTDASTGYSAGDEFEIGHNFWSQTGENRDAVNVIFDAATQDVRIQYESGYSSAGNFRIQHKTGGNSITATAGILQNFKFKIRTWQSGFASSGTNAGPLTSEPGYYFSGLSSGTAGDYIFGTTAASRQVVFNHGLSSVPKLVRSVFVATSDISELGLVSGQEIDTSNLTGRVGNFLEWHLIKTVSTTSQVRLNVSLGDVGQSPSPVWLTNNSTNRIVPLTSDMMSKMKFKLYAWK